MANKLHSRKRMGHICHTNLEEYYKILNNMIVYAAKQDIIDADIE